MVRGEGEMEDQVTMSCLKKLAIKVLPLHAPPQHGLGLPQENLFGIVFFFLTFYLFFYAASYNGRHLRF